VLPPRLDDQRAALNLALCDDIGQAAYDGEAVALALIYRLVALEAVAAAGVSPGLLQARYGPALGALAGAEGAMAAGVARAVALPPAIDAETWLAAAAERHTSGDTARMAQRLLDDFRRGVLGAIALELPG
jgi:ribosome biogenesis GTPase A